MNALTHRPRRGGFTLVELLVVIVVLAVLAALLLPAIQGAIQRARDASVSAEINQMAQALADFKSKYGDYPPSRILLHESGNYATWLDPTVSSSTITALPATGTTADISYQQLALRSIQALRKFWPRVILSTSGGQPAVISTTNYYDFNGNGQNDGFYILDGRECLTFFLGGIPSYGINPTTTKPLFLNGTTGFGRNPANPFSNTMVGNAMSSNNRSAPLFEFKGSRLMMLPDRPANVAGSTTYIPGYTDASSSVATPRIYAYFSAYGSNNYDPNDVNAMDINNEPNYETDDSAGTAISLKFRLPFPAYSSGTATNFSSSPPPNPYTTTATNTTSTATITSASYLSPQSFQIISPGNDSLYGLGGQYTPDAAVALPLDATNATATDLNIRTRERDNLTNFHNGRLD